MESSTRKFLSVQIQLENTNHEQFTLIVNVQRMFLRISISRIFSSKSVFVSVTTHREENWPTNCNNCNVHMLAVVCGRFYEWRLIWVSCIQLYSVHCSQMKAILLYHISLSLPLALHFICLWFLACCWFLYFYLSLCLQFAVWIIDGHSFIVFEQQHLPHLFCLPERQECNLNVVYSHVKIWYLFTAWQGTFLINAIKVIKTVVQLQQNMCVCVPFYAILKIVKCSLNAE